MTSAAPSAATGLQPDVLTDAQYHELTHAVLAGIEALTGFALISCSAQLFWTMMHEGEKA